MKDKSLVLQCRRCGRVTQVTAGIKIDRIDDRCPDPKAPGGYWYCDYVELVPKIAAEKVSTEPANWDIEEADSQRSEIINKIMAQAIESARAGGDPIALLARSLYAVYNAGYQRAKLECAVAALKGTK